ncbi:MAG TPA: response regulator transcription factor [Anaerolineae bacterium]|nr:response regulator transcription factor [Anaerolineae bacterium]
MTDPISDRAREKVDHLGIDLDDLPFSAERGRVLIIDDDPDMVQLLKQTVRSAGMDVTGALNASDALTKCIRHPPDVLLLDLMMPEVDGWETLKSLRKYTNAPVVIVSAKASKDEIVEGLESGADDYITKPFYPPELISRVKAVMRRSGPLQQQTVLNFPDIELTLDMAARQAEIRGHAVDLSAKEFNVLTVLAQSAPKPVRYEIIAVEVWGSYQIKMRNRIKWLVHNLRRKLEDEAMEQEIIKNRVGFGYQLNIPTNHDENATTD